MEITSLNQQRKQLLLELHTLKNYRDYCINQAQQKISEINIDYGEKFFTLDGEYACRSFQDRFTTTMNYLTADVRENEDTLGVRLDDLDDEIDHIFHKLTVKEKEFEELEKEVRKPLRDNTNFKQTIDKFIKEVPDLQNPMDYVELQEIIERKEMFDNLLQEIIQQRENQMQQEVQKIQEEYLTNRINQKIVYCNLEQHTGTINNALKAKSQENYDRVNQEKEKLFEQFKQREIERHRKYGQQYKQLYDKSQMIDETDENEISEDSWKFHLFENQDEIIEKERKFREEQKRLDSLLLQYLSTRSNPQPFIKHIFHPESEIE